MDRGEFFNVGIITRLRELSAWCDADDPWMTDDMPEIMREAADALEKLQMMDVIIEIRNRPS